MKKYIIIGLIISLILISGCEQKEIINEKQPIPTNTISRLKQVEVFSGLLNGDYEIEQKYFRSAFNQSLDSLTSYCKKETNSISMDSCFDKVFKFIDEGESMDSELSEVWNEGKIEMIYKGQHTDVELFELYQELSRKLSAKSREVRKELSNIHREYTRSYVSISNSN